MKNQLFYTHEDDHQIMLKKDRVEVQHWIESLNFYNYEIEAFRTIEKKWLLNPNITTQLDKIKTENSSNLQELLRYEKASLNAWECDDLACDSFYLNNHERYRNLVMDHMKNYRNLKTIVFIQFNKKTSQHEPGGSS